MVKVVRDGADWYITVQIDSPRALRRHSHADANINVIGGGIFFPDDINVDCTIHLSNFSIRKDKYIVKKFWLHAQTIRFSKSLKKQIISNGVCVSVLFYCSNFFFFFFA